MKKIITIAILLILTSCTELTSPLEPSYAKGKITITRYTQQYYSSLGKYGMVYVYYEVENTGNTTIDYYKVDFIAITSSGTYKEWDNGTDVTIGSKSADYTIIDTSGKAVTGVTVGSTYFKAY